jgi:hypothetical protein
MRIFALTIAFAFLVFSCDSGVGNDTYDINSGVYPYEVTDVSYSLNAFWTIVTVSWKNPTNKNFSHVQIFDIWEADELNPAGESPWSLLPIEETSWIVTYRPNQDRKIRFHCVDKYGNISEGMEYIIPGNIHQN